jgi:O-antigen ligase
MLHILLFLVTLSFIGSQLTRLKLDNGVAFTLLDVAVFVTITVFLAKKFLSREKINGHLLPGVIAFVIASLISLVANSWTFLPKEIGVGSLYLLRFVMYSGLYFVVRELTKKQKESIKKAMCVAGISIIIGGFIQYVLYPDLDILYSLGWDEHLYRMYSTFLDPNYLGSFLVLFGLFFYQYNKKNLHKKNLMSLGFMSLAIVAIALTYSRSAIVMGITAIMCYFFLKKDFLKMGVIMSVFLLLIVLVSNSKIEGLNPFRIASTAARIESAQNAITIIKDHPVFGVGFNTYRYAQDKYGFRNLSLFATSHADAGTDNSFLFILATTGIVGLMAYCFLLKKIFEMRKFVQKEDKKIFLTILISLLAGSMFNNLLFYTPLMAWMWVYLGVTENT